MSSPQHFFFKRGLDVGKSQKSNFLATYNIRSPKQDSEKKIVLCKKGDDITRFDGVLVSSVADPDS